MTNTLCQLPDCYKLAKGILTNKIAGNPIPEPNGDGLLILHEIGSYFVCEDHMILLQVWSPKLATYTTEIYGLPN